MTPRIAATPTKVVTPEISISQRTLATILAAAGSRGLSSSTNGSLMAQRHPRRQKLVAAAADTGNRLDRVLTARVADLSRSRVKALILAGEVTVGGRTIRDPAQRRVRRRCDHRDRQAKRSGRASGRRQLVRYAGQCADRPLRREPLRH